MELDLKIEFENNYIRPSK